MTRAGHPHPLLLPATGPAHILDTPANPPLGMVHGPTTISTSPFAPGDTIVAFTDGLVERRTHPYDHGIEDLRTVLTEATGLPLETVADIILQRIPGTDDDRALALVRRR
ncbi:SpoIIE family protein phosphatase [Actinoplanes sp. NEAU-A12]|uniref:SpoIIE family protein phosphatase n=1 Tax=Actinoplanes sandaracinus TaxID=3045177 RepID=A0ABT6WW70_9ACTN|nr:SpoIIE family protein phosphatase [Actinoplanes sandaracinus]MDI6103989.1 SpoIIE family protein phosphatase [Actinoplanes sandaracinus]